MVDENEFAPLFFWSPDGEMHLEGGGICLRPGSAPVLELVTEVPGGPYRGMDYSQEAFRDSLKEDLETVSRSVDTMGLGAQKRLKEVLKDWTQER